MKLYEITVKPRSGFGTPLKGDTIFGHFCWQVAHDATILNGGLEKWVACYAEKPFVVFSSAWPKFYDSETGKAQYILKRPDLPDSVLFRSSGMDRQTQIKERKENKRKKWIGIGEDLCIVLGDVNYFTGKDLLEKAKNQATHETRRQMRRRDKSDFCTSFGQPHNTINRRTMTTGEGKFAPFSETTNFYYPETELVIFVLVDEAATSMERIQRAMERIGKWGYGKNASTGLGRFDLAECDELDLPVADSPNACYTLAPVVPQRGLFSESYFTPFIRFGKHGERLANSQNPFKNPVIMADEGAVFVPRDLTVFEKPYIGLGISGLSKSMPQTVGQGYSFYLPFKLEM